MTVVRLDWMRSLISGNRGGVFAKSYMALGERRDGVGILAYRMRQYERFCVRITLDGGVSCKIEWAMETDSPPVIHSVREMYWFRERAVYHKEGNFIPALASIHGKKTLGSWR